MCVLNEVKGMKLNMKKKTVIIIFVVLLVIVLIGVGGYFGYQKYQEYLLTREADKIGNLDILNDEVDMSIHTSGDYATVEETMKQYVKEYGEVSQTVISLIDDDTLKNLLTIERIQSDGPAFTETLTYLNQKKTDLETADRKSVV